MSEAIIVFNAGSTSVKFGAYEVAGKRTLTSISHGEVSDMQTDPKFVAKNSAGKTLETHEFGKDRAIDHRTALHFVITWLEKNITGMKVVAAGHRVVLGGTRFEAPVLIDADVLAYLDSLVLMEPSHQPYNVRGARALAQAFPGLPQVACFDSSFHRTMPEVAQIYALPKDVLDAGARHWGYQHLLRLHQPTTAEVRARRAPSDRRASWGRRQPMRNAGRKERRNDDGLRGADRASDGDPVRRCAAGPPLLPAAPQAIR
jgi:acetate kinase